VNPRDGAALANRFSKRLRSETIYMPESPVPSDEPTGSELGQLRVRCEAAHGLIVDAERIWKEIEANERLSETGKAEEYRDRVLRELLPRGRKLAEPLAVYEARVRETKAQMRAVPDRKPDDLAGVLDDQERRRHLFGAEPEERRRLLKDPAFLHAALRGPAALSGMNQMAWDAAHREALEAQHGEALEEVELLKAATVAARDALDRAKAALLRSCGLSREPESA
jgi:hypothetical protein